jgi:hypothetical protein
MLMVAEVGTPTKPASAKLDVFRMLAEMADAGVSTTEAARRLGISKSRMHRIKEGIGELTYSEGVRFIDLHGYVTASIVPSTGRG